MTTALRRTPLRRTALAVAALALSAGTLSACGGDDTDASSASSSASDGAAATPSDSATETPTEAPTETSSGSPSADTSAPATSSEPERVAKFCSIYSDLFTQVSAAMTSTGGFASVLPQLRDFGDQLKAVGLPDDAPADVKTGLDINLKVIDDLPDNATEQDLVAAGQKVTADEQTDAQAFGQYVLSSCPDLAPQLGGTPAP